MAKYAGVQAELISGELRCLLLNCHHFRWFYLSFVKKSGKNQTFPKKKFA
jgi:hypothetical protein